MKFIRSPSTTRRDKRSMQYYRFWIYSCNGVLGITSAIFAVFAAFVLTDVRLSLLGGVQLYHPTFLYAYAALILQCGVVQTIGCLGAKRLSHKLLSFYWLLLLVLTIGDVVVGLVWVFKLDKVKLNLRPLLTQEFISKYSTDELFTSTWNILQSEEHCCGVDGPLDYDKLSQVQSQYSSNPNSSLIIDGESSFLSLPESCCTVIYDTAPLSRGGGVFDGLNQTHRSPHHADEKEFSGPSVLHQDGDGSGGGWEDRGSDNLTNQFALGDNSGGFSSSDGGSYSSHLAQIDYEDALLNDAPQLSTDHLDSKEETFASTTIVQLPIPSNSNRSEKHRKRHENHRWKISPQIFSPENNSSNSNGTINSTSSEAVLWESNPGESKNPTKLKPHKTHKSLPTFSFPTKPNPTAEPEITEKLPMPFTCQRHLKVRNQWHGGKGARDNTHPVGTSNYGKSNVEIGDDATFSTTAESTPHNVDGDSSEVETNDIGNLRDEKNNDEQQHSFNHGTFSTRKFQSNRNRRKRRHSPVSVSSSRYTTAASPKFNPVAGSNLFSFLHASAFPFPEDADNGNSNVDSGSETIHPGRAATEIQAAYYFSSSYYQSNSLNASLEKRFHVFRHGCGVKLIQWLDHVSGILFILGFCIIGFVKASFLFILRTEIREMIEKIQILELDNSGSPSRSLLKDQRLSYVPHPLLSHPHRASTVSANAYNAALPTIKSPDGPATRFSKSYQMRRHSNIIGDRSSTHSQETVNMTLLVTNTGSNHGQCASGGCTNHPEPKQEKGRSNPNLSQFILSREDFDPISISVPNTAKYLRRSSTCSVAAHPGPGYAYLPHYDGDPRPGPSSRFYHHEAPRHHLYHQHCIHGHPARPRLYARNMSIGAVGASAAAAAARAGFGGESGGGSGNCSFSSRDENEILSASMENVVEVEQPSPSDDEKEQERRTAEIRDWAAATACTEISLVQVSGDDSSTTPTNVVTVPLGDYTKAGFNHSSDSAESNGGGRRNGNNNVDVGSIPRSYLGTAV